MRLFFGLPVPAEGREILARFARDQGLVRPRWRPAHPDTFHLTLRFLGETPPLRLEPAVAALEAAAAGGAAFDLAVGRLSGLPGPGRARTAVLRLAEGEAQARSLAQRLEEALAAAGFPREGRPWVGHLTLARAAGEPLAVREGRVDLRWRATVAVLWESELGGPHAVHRVVREVPLGGG